MPSIMYENLFYILLTLFQHFTRFPLQASQTNGCQGPGPRSLWSPAPLILPAWQTANPLLKPQGEKDPRLSFFFHLRVHRFPHRVCHGDTGIWTRSHSVNTQRPRSSPPHRPKGRRIYVETSCGSWQEQGDSDGALGPLHTPNWHLGYA